MSDEAFYHLVDFHDEIEREIGPGKGLEPIAAFAGRATENATRLAGIMSVFDNPDSNIVGLEAAESGTDLARFYLASVRGLRAFADSGRRWISQLILWKCQKLSVRTKVFGAKGTHP